MRLPLLPILLVLTLCIGIDVYIGTQLRRRQPRLKSLRKVNTIVSIAFNALLLILICVPKRSGDEDSLKYIMWG